MLGNSDIEIRYEPMPDAAHEKIEQELRRGAVVLAVLSQLREPQYGYSLRQALSVKGMPIEEGTL